MILFKFYLLYFTCCAAPPSVSKNTGLYYYLSFLSAHNKSLKPLCLCPIFESTAESEYIQTDLAIYDTDPLNRALFSRMGTT